MDYSQFNKPQTIEARILFLGQAALMRQSRAWVMEGDRKRPVCLNSTYRKVVGALLSDSSAVTGLLVAAIGVGLIGYPWVPILFGLGLLSLCGIVRWGVKHHKKWRLLSIGLVKEMLYDLHTKKEA